MNNRILHWDGCKNVRDLGGLQAITGGQTRWHAIIRSDTPARLTPSGWSDLYTYGIRTIISLSTIGLDEPELDVQCPYPDIDGIKLPIEDITDEEFVQQWVETDLWCTPLYYRDALLRWSDKYAAVISAIARAKPGGVLFHCTRGNDRTGIIALLVLSLAGVSPDDILADYELSPDPDRYELLAREQISIRDALRNSLNNLNLDGIFRSAGAGDTDIDAVRQKLL